MDSSFDYELYRLVELLKACKMPQETINMLLAAKCGVPLMPIDCKSMYVQWTVDEQRAEL